MMYDAADYTLDTTPDADQIERWRGEAREAGRSLVIAYGPATTANGTDDEARFLVVSDRGTCAVLGDDVTIDAFHPGVEADTVAHDLRTTQARRAT
jgi:hypothetical protein